MNTSILQKRISIPKIVIAPILLTAACMHFINTFNVTFTPTPHPLKSQQYGTHAIDPDILFRFIIAPLVIGSISYVSMQIIMSTLAYINGEK